jgi:hypothetical protein
MIRSLVISPERNIMNRRAFLGAGALALATLALPERVRADETTSRAWIEIRHYRFLSAEQNTTFAEMISKAGVDAMNRAGARPVGLFRLDPTDNPKLDPKPDPNDLWMVIPHASSDAFVDFEAKLAADDAYQSAAKDVLSGDKDHPPFARYNTLLLRAFSKAPSLIAPELKPDRVLELRTYQSRNPERAANKIAMFQDGEIPIFTQSGMPPVFFGGALAGWDLPQLTYMICHESMDASKENWKRFNNNEEWKKLRTQPQYKDNVSKIVNRFLRPLPGSQI